MKNRNFIMVVAIMAAVTAMIFVPKMGHKNRAQEAQMANFPMAIGDWQGKDMPLTENDYAILETKNLIMREYTNNQGQMVYLYIIYSGDNRKALHPPEICYTGGGSTILEKKAIPLSSRLQANEFIIEVRGGRQLVTYWFRAGNFNTASYLKQQLKTAAGRAMGKNTSGAMIRISTIMQGQDKEVALKTIAVFAGLIEPFLEKYAP